MRGPLIRIGVLTKGLKLNPRAERDYHRSVRLCAGAAARRQLIDARLATPADFKPVEVLDAPPPGAAVFDGPGVAPPPGVFTDEQLAAARKTVAQPQAAFDARPKPPMPVNPPPIAKLVPKIKRVVKNQGNTVARGADPESLAAAAKALRVPLPARWAELLKAIDGFAIDQSAALDGTAELRVAPAKDLKEEYRGARVMLGDHLPKTHLPVATSDIGDRVFLDTPKVTVEGDCPVLIVNHETGETEMTWQAIGLFLSDAVEVSDDE